MALEASNSAGAHQPGESAGAAGSQSPLGFPWPLELALSGGGLRAAAYALGALIYLCHSEANKNVRNVSSVSGASLTNAFVACHCDFSKVSLDEFRPHASRLVDLIAHHGIYKSRHALAFAALLACLALPGFAGLVFSVTHGIPWYFTLALVGLSVLLVAAAVPAVSWVIRGWMKSTFLRNDDDIEQLGQLSDRAVDHVFCATDVNRGFPYFFSTADGGRQYSRLYGRADGKAVPIVTAVQASAAYPPLLPAVDHRLDGKWAQCDLDSKKYDGEWPDRLFLTDGGAFNNFGTDWHGVRKLLWSDSIIFWNEVADPPRKHSIAADDAHDARYGEVQLAIDASQAGKEHRLRALKDGRHRRLRTLNWPLIGLVSYVVRTMQVMYSSTLFGRADDGVIQAQTQMKLRRKYWRAVNAEPLTDEQRHGFRSENAVRIYVPYSWSLQFMIRQWGEWELERDAQTMEYYPVWLPDIREQLEGVWRENEVVPTHFKSLGAKTTLSLVVSGYLMTRQALVGAFGFKPLRDIPSRCWFKEFLGPPQDSAITRALIALRNGLSALAGR